MKTVCIDFDGVIHSYTSGWKGATNIPDPPVPGAFDFIRDLMNNDFEVVIFSTRANHPNSARAIWDWFAKHGWEGEYCPAITHRKISAILYIDDRGFHFKGEFPSIDYIKNFKPWNREEK